MASVNNILEIKETYIVQPQKVAFFESQEQNLDPHFWNSERPCTRM